MTEPLFLTTYDASKVHEASLEVLERTGIDLFHDGTQARELLLDNGAKEDSQERILIPRNMVEDALKKVPREFWLYNRDGDSYIEIKNGNTFFGPGSDSMYNYDKKTGRLLPTDDSDPRNSTLNDLVENVRIADALDFDFMMSMSLPSDVEAKKLYATVFAEMSKNTDKPLVFTSTNLEDMKHIHDIANIISDKPFYVAYVEPISPLRFDASCTQRLLYCAENNIPVSFAAGANCGGGAPITPVGGVVQGSAESLAGLVIAMLKNPDAKFVYGANTSAMDMNTTIISYGAPEWAKTVAMYADMGKFYNLPSWGTGGCTDARIINRQSSAEAYEGIIMALQSGSTMVHDVGYLGHGEVYHPGMLVFTKSLIDRAKKLLSKPDVSDAVLRETVEVIDMVARSGGLYLAHPHTAENFKEALWLPPKFYEKGHSEDWDANSLQNRLQDEAIDILASAEPKELPYHKAKEIEFYLENIS